MENIFFGNTMTTKKFHDVYDTVELGSLIMDCLALPALLALSYTTKLMHAQVHRYLHMKLIVIFTSFGITADDIITHLRLTNSLIIGSIALRAVAPITYSISSSHLDILVPTTHLSFFKDWLTITCGYTQELSPSICHELLFHVRHHQMFVHQIGGRKKVINVFGVQTIEDTYKMLFYSSNTSLMNAITGWGLFTPYRSLLNRGLVAHNHIENTLVVGEVLSTLRAQLFRAALLSEIRTRINGFLFIPTSQHLRLPCQCPNRSACPLRIRHTNDSFCTFLRIFTNAEWSALQSTIFIPIDNPCLPLILWRLASEDDDSPGFSIRFMERLFRYLVAR